MAVIETRYSIGDVVWRGYLDQVSRQLPCPDCLGTEKWTCISPAGGVYEVPCPRCMTRYVMYDDLSLSYIANAPRTERLTIGSVQTNTADGRDPVSYMCIETGVGSGSVY